MSLYVSQGRTSGRVVTLWSPGDPGSPNRADSRHELITYCPKPDDLPCPSALCDETCHLYARPTAKHHKYPLWSWRQHSTCQRCLELHNCHNLTLAELIAMWETQNRRCHHCDKSLPDPRTNRRETVIDHNHQVCPQRKHSCERCRRGLALRECNTTFLAEWKTGLWVLPEKPEDVDNWLQFIGSQNRDRLRKALTLFPEQPVRTRPHRRRPQAPGDVIPLFESEIMTG